MNLKLNLIVMGFVNIFLNIHYDSNSTFHILDTVQDF